MASVPDEIQITEEMIDAAADVLLRDPFIWDRVIGEEALAEEMLRAALSARRHKTPLGDP
jgi:hypothetical protein